MKLGSLFDGSGGFPLGGIIAGITPAWASEIEPFPIRVTEKRLPQMKHYGDVSKISGADLEPVDIITFGSPCQDMSVAGKRAGLKGARSGLFFQAVRIIKEMRDKTNGKYPRYAVWENVRGALSSARGADFRQVLEELCRIKNPGCSVPGSERWNPAGCIMADGFSLAWRVLDAQFWGVPQRRKRIYLVCDFAGYNAPRILFESESVSGNPETLRGKEQRTAGTAEERTDKTICLNAQLGTGGNNTPLVCYSISKEDHMTKAQENKTATLAATDYKNPVCVNTPDCRVRRLTPLECARLQGFPDWWTDGLTDSEPSDAEVRKWQGIFDEYCDINGKKRKTASQIRKWLMTEPTDAAKYKMWGNGVALPCVVFVLAGIVAITENKKNITK